MKLDLRGVLAPVPTPFAPDGAVDHAALARNLSRWCQSGLSGVVLTGSNGEAVMLSLEEKAALWNEARRSIPGHIRFLAGAGAESVRSSLAELQLAAKAGAEAALVLTPHYYRAQTTPALLESYYLALAEASPLPIVLYNMPGSAAGVDLDVSTVVRLSQHPRIVGIKDSSGNIGKIGALARAVNPGFAVVVGSGGAFYPALCMGACGTVAALANLRPEQTVELYRHFLEGRHDEARALQHELIPVNNAITARWGVAGLKAALDLEGRFFGGAPRAPLAALGAPERDKLARILEVSAIPR